MVLSEHVVSLKTRSVIFVEFRLKRWGQLSDYGFIDVFGGSKDSRSVSFLALVGCNSTNPSTVRLACCCRNIGPSSRKDISSFVVRKFIMKHRRLVGFYVQRFGLDVIVMMVPSSLLASRFVTTGRAIAVPAWMQQLRDVMHVEVLNRVGAHEQLALEHLAHLARWPPTHPRRSADNRQIIG